MADSRSTDEVAVSDSGSAELVVAGASDEDVPGCRPPVLAASATALTAFRFFFPAAAEGAAAMLRLDFVRAAAARDAIRVLDRDGEAEGATGDAAASSTTMTSTAAPLSPEVAGGAAASPPVALPTDNVAVVDTGAVPVPWAWLVSDADSVGA